MSDLTSIGASALRAYQAALSTVGNNVANSETVGYVRRSIITTDAPPVPGGATGRFSGTQIQAIQRNWDRFLADDVRRLSSDASQANIRSHAMQQIETAVAPARGGIGERLTAFFNSATTLAGDPFNAAEQRGFINRLDDVTGAFRITYDELTEAQQQNAVAGQADIDAVNRDLTSLAQVNGALRNTSADGAQRAALEDERDLLLGAVAARIDITVDIGDHGTARVTSPGAATLPLVNGIVSATISVSEDMQLRATSDEGTTVITLSSGALAARQSAYIELTSMAQQLDGFATEFVQGLNQWATQGRRLDGASGTTLLSATGAHDISVIAVAPSELPIASATGIANGNLLALETVRSDLNLEARWTGVTTSHALATQSAVATAEISETVFQQQAAALDLSAGVDLDSEAALLLRYQQAHSAAAHILRVAQDVIDTILDLR